MKIALFALTALTLLLASATIGLGIAYSRTPTGTLIIYEPAVNKPIPLCKEHQPFLERMTTFKTLYSSYIKEQENSLFDFYKEMGSSIAKFNSSKLEIQKRIDTTYTIYGLGKNLDFDCKSLQGDDFVYALDLNVHINKYKEPLRVNWTEMINSTREHFENEVRDCVNEDKTGVLVTDWVHEMEKGDAQLHSMMNGSNYTAFIVAKNIFHDQKILLENTILDKQVRDSKCNRNGSAWNSNNTDVYHRVLMYEEIEKTEFKG